MAGCRTDVDVAVKQNLDGTGEVRVSLLLDAQAAEQVGDIRRTIRVADLEAAGWRLVGPTTSTVDQSMRFEVVKSFRNPGEATLALNELTGEEGPFSQLVVDRNRTPVRISSSVRGDLDFTTGYETFGDVLIAQTLQTTSLIGVEPELIAQRFGAPIEQLLPVTVTVELPGADPKKFSLVPGQVTKINARSSVWNIPILAPLGVFVVGLIVLFRKILRRQR